MKISLVSCILLFLTALTSHAQNEWSIDRQKVLSYDSVTNNGYTLEFINNDPDMNDSLKQRMITAFFTVYPAEAEMYNKLTAKKVIFFMDTGYLGVAATSGNIVRFNPKWFHKNPGDIDVVTHEVMHIVQSYPDNAGPWWLTEGIADYARHIFGVDNAGAHWSLTAFASTQNFDNGYRITARFLTWLEKNKRKGIVVELDAAMRSKTYHSKIWKQLTGETIGKLWEGYAKDPTI